jgi:hypothetical protein
VIRHDLRLVRGFLLDGTLHCEAHGLLNEEESADVLSRAGLTERDVTAFGPASRWQRLLDRIWRLSRPHCEIVQ